MVFLGGYFIFSPSASLYFLSIVGDSEVDFARYVLEEYYSNPIPDDWLCYFDYEAFARDLFINDFCSVEVDGNVHVFSYH
jgi:antirestriction protein